MARGKTLLIFSVVVLIWGFYYLAIDLLLSSGWDPYLLNALRFTVGGLLLLAVAVRRYGVKPLKQLQKTSPVKIITVAWLGTGMGIALMTLGQKTVDSGISGVLGSTTPLFSALLGLSLIFGRRLIGPVAWLGIAVGLVGVTLLYKPWGISGGIDPAGASLLLAGAFCFALEAWLVSKWFANQELLTLSALTVMWTAISFIIGFLALGQWQTGSWLLLVAMAFLSNALAYVLYLWLVQNPGPLFANLYAYLVPVIALLAGIWLNNESLAIISLTGSACCILGAILVGRDSNIAVDH